MNAIPSSSNCAPNSHLELYQEDLLFVTFANNWQEWLQQADDSEYVSRYEAAYKLSTCESENHHELNLSDMGLTSFPPGLPGCIRRLDISGNRIAELPRIDTDLYELDISDNLLTELPVSPPPNLRIIKIGNNPFTHVPEKWQTLINDAPRLDASREDISSPASTPYVPSGPLEIYRRIISQTHQHVTPADDNLTGTRSEDVVYFEFNVPARGTGASPDQPWWKTIGTWWDRLLTESAQEEG